MYNLIKKYIGCMNMKDVDNFAKKKGITLSKEELEIVYNVIKREFDVLITNKDYIFSREKNNFTVENYHKILNLFIEYQKKYKSYL